MLTLDQVHQKAPSVFATAPWGEVSDKYTFIPTSAVLDRLFSEGFEVAKAAQSRTRIPGKGEFTRHQLRLRMPSASPAVVGQVIPEVVLTNSHDRTSAFRLDAGLYRLVCSNGLTVASGGPGASVSVRHSGDVSDVIEGVFSVVDQFPAVLETVDAWRGITLNDRQQAAYATAALELNPSNLAISPDHLTRPRRREDTAGDLFTVFNRVQENMVKGGLIGRNANGRRMRTRTVTGIDADGKLNKALWALTEEMAKLMA